MINETPKFPIAQASRTTAHGPSRLETITPEFFCGYCSHWACYLCKIQPG
jgi:hypothetical protein